MSGGGRTRVLMRRVDAALLLAGVAAMTLWLSLTDGMLRYVRPSMRPWLVASGVFLGLLAAAVAASGWWGRRRPVRGSTPPSSSSSPSSPAPACGPDGCGAPAAGDDHGHGRRRGLGLVGWLIGLPLVVAVSLDPGALGAYSIRQSAGGLPAIDFDLEQHLRTRSFGGQAPELLVHEFLLAADADEADQSLLASTPVRLTGFVVTDEDSGGFRLARFIIGCCAGDAIGLLVDVRGLDGEPLADETWIQVTGTYDPAATESARAEDGGGGAVPVLQASSVREVEAPAEPYEYPR